MPEKRFINLEDIMRDKLGRFIKGHHSSPETELKKGRTPWNKGTKGIMKINSGSFKKGFQFWLGKKRQNMSGINHPNWKNEKMYNGSKGYTHIWSSFHPRTNCRGYIRRSRLVMEKHLGRYLTPEEVVHHKGIKYPLGSVENRQDDRLENLKLFATNVKHLKFHNKAKN